MPSTNTVLLDACVLFPTVLRRILTGMASKDVFTPLWSPRILEEWSRAAAREGFEAEADAEIANLRAQFPAAEIVNAEEREKGLFLPDPDDVHVLAAAIAGGADELLTLNTKDFPGRVLASHGIQLRHPDEFVLEALHLEPSVGEVIRAVHFRAIKDGLDLTPRALLKRSRLPRVGKEMERRFGKGF